MGRNDDTRRSFALTWNRDQDPRWHEPDFSAPEKAGVPTWHCKTMGEARP